LNGNVVASQTVTLSSNATTVAGGFGSGGGANQFNGPDRLYVDGAGIMYIPDLSNNRVQKWLPGATSGITVAGGNGAGAAANQFSRPSSVFVDQQGNIYVTDQNNKRVQKWAPGASTGTTVANDLQYPTDVFVDKNGTMYVSDQLGHVVKKYAPGSTTGVIVAGNSSVGNGSSSLFSPTGIFVDAAGNLYICDTDNLRVQKWTPGATLGTTIANGYNPLDVSVDCDGNVFVCDYVNNQVLKYPPGSNPGTAGTIVAGGNGQGAAANQLYNPIGVFIVGNNHLYVADYSNHRVQRFSNSIDPRYVATAPGVYTITIDYPCCPSYVETFEIYNQQNPSVTITATDATICPADEVTFSAGNTNQIANPIYQWKLNGTNVGANTNTYVSRTLKDNDEIICILSSNKACTLPGADTSNKIKMEVSNSVPLNLGPNFSICPGNDTILKAPQHYISYTWQDNSTQTDILIHNTGKYHLTVLDACNNTFRDTVEVAHFRPIRNFLPADTTICTYDQLILAPNKPLSDLEWSTQTNTPSITINQPGLYWLHANDANNCATGDSIYVRIETCPPKGIYVPNAFSPNNNYKNEIFKPVVYGAMKQYKFAVFNRYGQQIFTTTNRSAGWDGKVKGLINAGSYVWYCQYQLDGQPLVTKKGTVTLIK
jgi:gliding motility-associated-like protein